MRKGLALLALLSLVIVGGMAITTFGADSNLTASEKVFIKDAANRGNFEVQLGKVAQQKGSAQQVKDLGKMMEADHKKAGDELNAIATRSNLLPSQLEHRYQIILDRFSKLSGAEFDKEYLAAMVREHEKDIRLFKKVSKKVKDPDLKRWIDQTLPTLEQHLAEVKATSKMIGAK